MTDYIAAMTPLSATSLYTSRNVSNDVSCFLPPSISYDKDSL